MKLLLLFIIMFCTGTIFSQGFLDSVPIVFYNKKQHDHLPKSIRVSGVIVEATAGFSCGTMASSGTIKIKPDLPSKKFNFPFIYAVVPCFSSSDVVGKKISCSARLARKGHPEIYQPIINSINSDNVPFYLISNLCVSQAHD